MSVALSRQQPRRTTTQISPILARGTGFELLLAVIVLVSLWLGWRATARIVVVTIDGKTEELQTHRRSVATLLTDLGITLTGHDRVEPGIDTPLSRHLRVEVQRARTWRIFADGRDLTINSWGTTPQSILADAAIVTELYDEVLIDGEPFTLDALVPGLTKSELPHTFRRGYAWDFDFARPLQMRLRRALEIKVDEGSLPYVVRTTAQTVGEALRHAGVTLYLGDRVLPSLGSSIEAGMWVYIERSTPVTLAYDNKVIKTRTRAQSVGESLSELGVVLSGLDRIEPPLDTKLFPDIQVKLTRIREEIEVEEEITSFETVFRADGNLPIDEQQLVNPGAEGITRNRYRVRYENGAQVDRVLEDRWLAQSPTDRVIAYGQKIEQKIFIAADGTPVAYWRKIRVYATSYSASRAGVSPDNPYYGKTFTGKTMRYGYVAVDPKVIALNTRMFVEGFGIEGDAQDTGSAILGRHIDLGYNDDNYVAWRKWIDIYLVWPPPSNGQITWVLPNFPKE